MASRWCETDIPDLSGKTALVTGGNSGLGLETCRALAGRGARVLLGSRDPVRGEIARTDILRAHPGAAVEVVEVDVASLASVEAAAAAIAARTEALDVLVNNAGVMATPQGQTTDGFELQLGTNHLGHFALTGRLFGLLAAAPAARVVHVSSLAARDGAMRWDDLMHRTNYHPFRVYAQSKLANQLFAFGMHRRMQALGSSVDSIAAHPGFAQTNLLSTTRGASWLAPIIKPFIGMVWNDAAQGALPQLYAACAPEAEPGGYYGPDGRGERVGWPAPARIPEAATSEADQDRLWRESEDLTGVRWGRPESLPR